VLCGGWLPNLWEKLLPPYSEQPKREVVNSFSGKYLQTDTVWKHTATFLI
jgi:hypothetical protein